MARISALSRHLKRTASRALVLGCAMTALFAAGLAAPAAHAAAGPSPRVVECTYTHWGGFSSNEASGEYNGYRVIAVSEGQYDNYDRAFCGGVRGHLEVYIPQFQVGGSASLTFSYGNLGNSGSPWNAGSSGYWYNLYTNATYDVQCGSTQGFFTPAGGTQLIANTGNACAA